MIVQDTQFDYIIVGGGAAGCVLAARLSESPALNILLLEAGPDFAPGKEPAWVSDARFRAHYDAAIFSPFFPIRTTATRVSPYRQARLIGGGSSVNGMHAQRGFPQDYDGWASMGVDGWAWQDVLPYFRKLEHDRDFAGSVHGDAGPIPISRVPDSRWSRLSLALRSALERKGMPRTADFNDATGDGVGPVPLNIDGLARVSTAAGYLNDKVRARPNLVIRGRSSVRQIMFRDGRAVGVEVAAPDGGTTMFHGHDVILSAGVYQSPALLLRSGIGPAETVSACGIAPVADRPGVGRTLRNHAQLPLTIHLKPGARQPDSHRPPCTMIARYSSGMAQAGDADMLINLWERIPGALADDPLSRQFGMVMVLMNKAFSEGSVTLDPNDPYGPPRIDCNALGDPRDLDRMVAGLHYVADLLASRDVAPLINAAFFAVPDRLMRMLMAYDAQASWFSRLGAIALSMPGLIRNRLLRTRGPMLADVLRDEARTRQTILDQIQPSGHGTATCRMGATNDPLAVTDSRCRVIGVDGLRVVDGSIFPDSMHAGTHLPIIMAAEKAAAMILADRNDAQGSKAA